MKRRFTDGVNLCSYIYNIWRKAYNLQKEGKEYYSHHKILLNNQILKDDFEKYKTRQEKSITDDEKATIFVKIVEDDEAVPGHSNETRTFSDGKKISNYWEYQKRSMLQLIKAKKEYQSNHKILLNNPLLKEDFEKYKKDNEISITDNEKAIEYVVLVNAKENTDQNIR